MARGTNAMAVGNNYATVYWKCAKINACQADSYKGLGTRLIAIIMYKAYVPKNKGHIPSRIVIHTA